MATIVPPVAPDVQVRQVSLDSASVNIDVASSQEGTRSKIAWTFTLLFLSLITLCIVGPFGLYFAQAPGMQNPVDVSKELVTLVSSVLAGPFGFIVGFYFKQGLTEGQ